MKGLTKELKISKPVLSKRILGLVINYAVVAVSIVALYFSIIYGICGTCFNYVTYKNQVSETLKENKLDYDQSKDYLTYKEVVDEIYFNKYPNEILTFYQNSDSRISSIEHAYNVYVLNLPVVPTVDSYKTDYYEYAQNSDGSFNTNVVANRIEGSGKRYESNMQSLFYKTYSNLNSFVYKFDSEYKLNLDNVQLQERIVRLISSIIPMVIFMIVLPLTNKYGSNIFEKKFNIGRAERRNGFIVKKYQIFLRNFVGMILPVVGIVFFNIYSVVILSIAPLFLNILVMIINKNNYDLMDLIMFTESIEINNSLIFKNEKEEYIYIKEHKDVYMEDDDLLSKLEKIDKIDLSVSRSENIKKD